MAANVVPVVEHQKDEREYDDQRDFYHGELLFSVDALGVTSEASS
jgi:hypothetical protein